MTSKQVLNRINTKKGQFFKVTFRRKNNKYVNGKLVHKAGDIREMLCRRGVRKFVKGAGKSNKASDIKNDVLTVFDVTTYNNLRKIMEVEKAGQSSYRRIPLNNVINIQ